MKRKQYIKPLSVVCACNTEGAMMTLSNTLPTTGGDGSKKWYSKRNDDFDDLDESTTDGSWE